MTASRRGATLLVVGDVHNHWRPADRAFVEGSGADLALFVGDLGDEDAAIASAIASIRLQKAVILGNHDAWQSFSLKRATGRLRRVIAALKDDLLGYAVRECYAGACSLIGARPFSWGGQSLRSVELYRELHGVGSMEQSAQRIVEMSRRCEHRDIILVAHNGPKGLSSEPADIWGKDFGNPGGDWGDEDLRLAIERIEADGLRVRAVVAGHMHDRLMHPRGALRTRFVRRQGTLFVNAAVVPRLRSVGDGPELGHFVRLQVCGGEVTELAEIWVDGEGQIRHVSHPEVRELPHVP
ncbi:MAG: TIGR04168 family protein [Planctomycetota bacterium]